MDGVVKGVKLPQTHEQDYTGPDTAGGRLEDPVEERPDTCFLLHQSQQCSRDVDPFVEPLEECLPLHRHEQCSRHMDSMLLELMSQESTQARILVADHEAATGNTSLQEVIQGLGEATCGGLSPTESKTHQRGLISNTVSTEIQHTEREAASRPGSSDPPHSDQPSLGNIGDTQAQQRKDQLAPAKAEPPEASGVGTLQASATTFLESITAATAEMSTAPPPSQSRSRRQRNVGTPLRRSRRLATGGPTTYSVQKAQAVLMKWLRIMIDEPMPSPNNLEAYARLFDHPLSPSHIAALAALFGWTAPESSETHSADVQTA